MGDFTFWISLSLSKRLSETVNLSPKIRSKTEVWIRFQLRLSLSEKIISRLQTQHNANQDMPNVTEIN